MRESTRARRDIRSFSPLSRARTGATASSMTPASSSRELAAASLPRLAADQGDVAPVLAGRRQGAHDARAVPQSLVARDVVRFDARGDDRADAVRRSER